MERTLEILEEKNKHLEKFYRLNESEILKFADGNFDQLEIFYDSREGLLELIKRMDLLLEKENLDSEQKVALWTLLPSKVRSALKNAKG